MLYRNIVKEEVFSVLLWSCQTKHTPCSPDLFSSTEVNASGDSVVSDTHDDIIPSTDLHESYNHKKNGRTAILIHYYSAGF